MRALSLTQPWASAVVAGLKTWETRSWGTRYRGQLAIHAAKAMPAFAKELEAAIRALHPGVLPAALPFGKVIAVCSLGNCVRINAAWTGISEMEAMLGDFALGRYAWALLAVRPIHAVPARGFQGLWNWEVP